MLWSKNYIEERVLERISSRDKKVLIDGISIGAVVDSSFVRTPIDKHRPYLLRINKNWVAYLNRIQNDDKSSKVYEFMCSTETYLDEYIKTYYYE